MIYKQKGKNIEHYTKCKLYKLMEMYYISNYFSCITTFQCIKFSHNEIFDCLFKHIPYVKVISLDI